MRLWTWVVIGVGILVLGIITGFWQHLFSNTHPTPWQVGPGGRGWLSTTSSFSFFPTPNTQDSMPICALNTSLLHSSKLSPVLGASSILSRSVFIMSNIFSTSSCF